MIVLRYCDRTSRLGNANKIPEARGQSHASWFGSGPTALPGSPLLPALYASSQKTRDRGGEGSWLSLLIRPLTL